MRHNLVSQSRKSYKRPLDATIHLLCQELNVGMLKISARIMTLAIKVWNASWLVRYQPNRCTLLLIEIESAAVQCLYGLIYYFSTLTSNDFQYSYIFSRLFLPNERLYQTAQQFMILGFQISIASDSKQLNTPCKPSFNENFVLPFLTENVSFRRHRSLRFSKVRGSGAFACKSKSPICNQFQFISTFAYVQLWMQKGTLDQPFVCLLNYFWLRKNCLSTPQILSIQIHHVRTSSLQKLTLTSCSLLLKTNKEPWNLHHHAPSWIALLQV